MASHISVFHGSCLEHEMKGQGHCGQGHWWSGSLKVKAIGGQGHWWTRLLVVKVIVDVWSLIHLCFICYCFPLVFPYETDKVMNMKLYIVCHHRLLRNCKYSEMFFASVEHRKCTHVMTLQSSDIPVIPTYMMFVEGWKNEIVGSQALTFKKRRSEIGTKCLYCLMVWFSHSALITCRNCFSSEARFVIGFF